MKVLVIGASGAIGLPVCQALVRAGHAVYGLTRTQATAKKLSAEEIIPIIGEITNPEPWLYLIASLDVVIEAVGGTANLPVIGLSLLEAISQAAKATRPSTAPKLSYIYTSGTWVHGESTKEAVSDTTPIVKPVPLVAWRPAVEQKVIQDPVLNGLIIRPGLVYGRSASLLAFVFERAYQGKVTWFGKPGGRFNLIHPDDLADLYVRAAEKAPVLGSLIFDATNNQTESVDDFLQKLVEVSGAKGSYEYINPSNAFEEALSTTIIARPYLAKSLLGWEQRKPGLVEGLSTYYAAWLAVRDEQGKQDRLFAKV